MMRFTYVATFSLIALALTSEASAALITRDIEIDLESDGRIFPFSPQPAWEGEKAISPVILNLGDEYLFRIRFLNGLAIQLSDNSGITELGKLSLLDRGGNNPNTPQSISLTHRFSYVGVQGDIQQPPELGTSGAGNCCISLFDRSDLTSHSFSYTGVDLLFNIDSIADNSSVLRFDSIEWSSQASSIEIVEVPTSATLTLVCLGLAGLRRNRRRFGSA